MWNVWIGLTAICSILSSKMQRNASSQLQNFLWLVKSIISWVLWDITSAVSIFALSMKTQPKEFLSPQMKRNFNRSSLWFSNILWLTHPKMDTLEYESKTIQPSKIALKSKYNPHMIVNWSLKLICRVLASMNSIMIMNSTKITLFPLELQSNLSHFSDPMIKSILKRWIPRPSLYLLAFFLT